MNRDVVNQCNNLIDVIKQNIKQEIDKEYTEYKNKCLQELDYKIEANRNECVKKVLDGIDVLLSADNPMSLEPNIMIKIEKRVVLK